MDVCSKKDKIYLVAYMFFLLFLPPLIKKINILLPLFVFSLFFIVFKYREEAKRLIIENKKKKWLYVILAYFGWYALSILINFLISKSFYSYNYFISLYSILLVVICVPVCALYIVLYCQDKDISFDYLIKAIIISGLIQSAIAILCLIFPWFKSLIVDIMYFNTGEKLYVHEYSLNRRFFGFANGLLDSFGFGTGLIALLPFYYSIRNSKKWLLSVPFLLLVPFLNSRTGLVVFLVGFIVFIIYIFKNKKIKEYALVFTSCMIGIAIFILVVLLFNRTTIDWIIRDLKSFFNSNINGTARTLFGDYFWRLPSDLVGLILGKSVTVAAYGGVKDAFGFTSDVGYINEIWKTGIVGLGIVCVFLWDYMKKIIKEIRIDYKFLVISLIPILMIVNIKFYVLCCNPGTTIIIIIGLYTFLNKKNKEVEEKDLISVIVPIYNVDDYLERCITSIIQQSYTNLEIILVNDGSPDNSEIICKKYAEKDSRIKYIKQQNKGLSGARNTGIKNSTGNYLIFIDSDDYVNKNFVKDLYLAIMKTKADVGVCYYKYVYDQEEDIDVIENGDITVYNNTYKFNNLYNFLRDYTVVAWNKIYSKKIFKNIKYPVGKIHEDQYIICDVLDNANSVAYINEELYYYLQRDNSITGQYKLNRIDILDALKNKMKYFNNKGMKKYYSYALYDYYLQLIIQRNNVKKYFPKEKKIIRKIDNELEKYKDEVYKSVYINPLKKVKLFLKNWHN